MNDPRPRPNPLRAERRRAKRVLVWAGLLFAGVQLAAGVLLDYGWPLVKFPSVASTLRHLAAHERSPDIICLGSSRFGAAFRTAAVQAHLRTLTGDDTLKVFNASIEAGDLVTADFVLEHILAQGTRPALLVLEVSAETVAWHNQWMGQHVQRQLCWEDTPAYWEEICRSGSLLRLLKSRTLPLYVHRRQIWRQAYAVVEDKTPAGLLPDLVKEPTARLDGVQWDLLMKTDKALTPPIRTEMGLGPIRKWLRDYRVGGSAARALDRLVQRCRQHGVAVLLIGTPLSSPHRQLYTPAINAAFLAHMRDLAETAHCRFYDCRDQVPDRHFFDNHHTTIEGGEYFSQRLAAEILAPAWQARQKMLARQADDQVGFRPSPPEE